jgi:CheY-like chemotaxis protein
VASGWGAQAAGDVGTTAVLPLRAAVVDDNRLMRVAVERQIRRLGHEVVLYASGPELIHAIEQGGLQFDVVLTDFNLPEMSGLEIIQHLRSRWPSLQVILYSGYVSDDVRQRAMELGALTVLRKEDTAAQLPEIFGHLARCPVGAVD